MNIKAIASAIILSAVSVAPMVHASEYCEAFGRVAALTVNARDVGVDKNKIDAATEKGFKDGKMSAGDTAKWLGISDYVYAHPSYTERTVKAVVELTCLRNDWEDE